MNNSSIAVPMEGYINEVRIWNIARSQEQIRSTMDSSLPAPATQSGLLAYYVFNDLFNKQGNAAYNGTIHNGAIINATNPNCDFIKDSCNVVLPLQITKFDAILQGNEVKLSWNTEQETNIGYYSIERSEDGLTDYQSIGIVHPVQNAVANTYSFIDYHVKPGILYSYRIVIYENSGLKKYSIIRRIVLNTKELSLTVFPNPANGIMNYKINNFRGIADISVSNSVGQILLTKQVSTISSQNLQLDLNNQPRGTYWLTVKTNDQHFVKKIIHL